MPNKAQGSCKFPQTPKNPHEDLTQRAQRSHKFPQIPKNPHDDLTQRAQRSRRSPRSSLADLTPGAPQDPPSDPEFPRGPPDSQKHRKIPRVSPRTLKFPGAPKIPLDAPKVSDILWQRLTAVQPVTILRRSGTARDARSQPRAGMSCRGRKCTDPRQVALK